jgi:hypothetical protein
MPVQLEPVNTTVIDDVPSHAQALQRLDYHRALLEREGVPPLSSLGALNLRAVELAWPGIRTAAVLPKVVHPEVRVRFPAAALR